MTRRTLRRSFRAATISTGLAFGLVLLGRFQLAAIAAAFAAVATLHVIHHLTRIGDR